MADTPEKIDFFISYTGADTSWALWIKHTLESTGYSVFYAPSNVKSGDDFIHKMHEAVENSNAMLVVHSKRYFEATFTTPEWTAAFHKALEDESYSVIPVLIDDTRPTGLFRPLSYVNLSSIKDPGEATRIFIRHIKDELPAEHPPYPGAVTTEPVPGPGYPGRPPPICNLPHRNPIFTGRDELLDELHEKLYSGQPTALTQAIRGLGGIGKTQMALEYAYRFSVDYSQIWWIHSEEGPVLAAEYAALADEIWPGEPKPAEQKLIVGAVRQWLEQNTGWLLIFDNVPEPNDVKPYLPRGNAGHVIITSRYQTWRGVAEPLQVLKMEPDDAHNLLTKITDLPIDGYAEGLAKELDYLPLAVEQAAAYINRCKISYKEYFEIYNETHGEVLEDAKTLGDYPDTVATTWLISCEKLKKLSPAGAALLNLCAFLAPDNIPKQMIIDGSEHLPKRLKKGVKEKRSFNNTVTALRHFSLIDIAPETLSIHRLLQAVVRDRMTNENRKKWAEAAVEIVQSAFPYREDEVETWKPSAKYLPQAFAAIEYAEELGVAPEPTGMLLNNVGMYLKQFAEFKEARGVLERAIRIHENTYGPDHVNVASVVNNLGMILSDLGDLQGAKEHYERALKIDEATYGPDHPDVAIDVNNLGSVLQNLGELQGAKEHYERALKIDEDTYGPNHPNVARDVNNLGSVLKDLGDLHGAKEHLKRALQILEGISGPEHPKVGTLVNNLGDVLQDLGDLQGAKEHLERALKIDEDTYGPNHPEVATDINNLGSVLNDLGDLKGAKEHFERALQILRLFFDEDHPNIKLVKRNLELLGE